MAAKINVLSLFVMFVVMAGLFAGAETGMYQLSRLRLRLGVQRKRLSYILLGGIMEDTRSLLLSLLIGTNLAHYCATSVITMLLYSRLSSNQAAEAAATAITAPILFIFSELVPKNIFYHRADYLMPAVSPVITAFHKLFRFSGIVHLLKGFSKITAVFEGAHAPDKSKSAVLRHPHIEAIISHTKEEGLLSATQTEIFNRLAVMSHINLRAVMTPMEKVDTVDAACSRKNLWQKLEQSRHTRLVVIEQANKEIKGVVHIYHALNAPEDGWTLSNFVRPMRMLAAEMTVSQAIPIMQAEAQAMVLVTSKDKPAGIVTMKDLAEELLGELAEW